MGCAFSCTHGGGDLFFPDADRPFSLFPPSPRAHDDDAPVHPRRKKKVRGVAVQERFASCSFISSSLFFFFLSKQRTHFVINLLDDDISFDKKRRRGERINTQ